jgi:hypothetical protein
MSQSDAAKLFDKFQPLFTESINQFYKVSACFNLYTLQRFSTKQTVLIMRIYCKLC